MLSTKTKDKMTMQKQQIFAVYDKKALAYIHPHFCMQKGMAIRSFEDAVNNKDSIFYRHPADFVLCHLGEFDDRLGLVNGLASPVNIEEAANLKTSTDKE